jgi:hypothetical protein
MSKASGDPGSKLIDALINGVSTYLRPQLEKQNPGSQQKVAYPGHIALMRMFCRPYEFASPFVRPTTPCLAAAYAV